MSRLLLIFLAPFRKVVRRKLRQDERLIRDLREAVSYREKDRLAFLAYLKDGGR